MGGRLALAHSSTKAKEYKKVKEFNENHIRDMQYAI